MMREEPDECDYGGCEEPVYSGINHEGEHWFCKYHWENVNP
jgi:hypothetical protein